MANPVVEFEALNGCHLHLSTFGIVQNLLEVLMDGKDRGLVADRPS